ncbi:MAG TPA: hypothetical protein VF698_18400 [Thermoanaerobaculia bacterium]|jgi:hypothetical protein
MPGKLHTIAHPHGEASALLGVQNRGLTGERGWLDAFWAISDEKRVEEAIVVVARGTGGWEVVPLRADAGKTKKTEDCETLARAGSWVYVLGSQFGSKDGPLEPRRHFVARFNESLAAFDGDELKAELHVARAPFVLHRIVNDAFAQYGLEVLRPGDEARQRFILDTIETAKNEEKSWGERVRESDVPINVEGSTFLPGGHLLLGLRFPPTRDGHPILVEVEGIDRLFDSDDDPAVTGIRVLSNVGSADAPAGIRELDHFEGIVHAITGNLDSKPEKSVLLAGLPEAANAPNEHWTTPLTLGKEGVTNVRAKRVRTFKEGSTVEGIALDGDRVWYAHDDPGQIVLEVV